MKKPLILSQEDYDLAFPKKSKPSLAELKAAHDAGNYDPLFPDLEPVPFEETAEAEFYDLT